MAVIPGTLVNWRSRIAQKDAADVGRLAQNWSSWAGNGLPRFAWFDDLRFGPVELSARHFELAAVRTGHFDAGLLGIEEDPFRVRAATGANNVALASLPIDGACVFHAL